MRFSVPLILILLAMMNCKSQKTDQAANDLKGQTSPGLTLLMSDNYGGTEHEEIQVIRSQGALDKFFIQINKTRKPGLTPPKVDFKKDMVIVYCSGKTKQTQLPELYTTKDPEKGVILNKKVSETSDNQEGNAVLMPFGLYIMSLTDKDISLQK